MRGEFVALLSCSSLRRVYFLISFPSPQEINLTFVCSVSRCEFFPLRKTRQKTLSLVKKEEIPDKAPSQ